MDSHLDDGNSGCNCRYQHLGISPASASGNSDSSASGLSVEYTISAVRWNDRKHLEKSTAGTQSCRDLDLSLVSILRKILSVKTDWKFAWKALVRMLSSRPCICTPEAAVERNSQHTVGDHVRISQLFLEDSRKTVA